MATIGGARSSLNVPPASTQDPSPATRSTRSSMPARIGSADALGGHSVAVLEQGAIEPRSAHVNGTPPNDDASALHERNVTQQQQPATTQSFNVQDLALGPTAHIANHVVNGLASGAIPQHLKPDLETALEYTQKVDRDIARLADLLAKGEAKPLNAKELNEAHMLAASNKHNLALVSTWLMEASGRETAPGGKAVLEALQLRFADRQMDLADLTSLHDLDGSATAQGVSRRDRIANNALWADAAVRVAQQLDAPGLSDEAKQSIVAELQAHADELSRLRDLAGAAGSPIPSESQALVLAPQEDWAEAFDMVKQKKGKPKDIGRLKTQWKANEAKTGQSGLPLTDAKVGQTRMLTEFIKHRLSSAGVDKKRMPDLKMMFSQATDRVFNQQDWSPIATQVHYRPNAGSDQTFTANSTITPAKAFSHHFAEPYEENGVHCSDRLQYRHVPNLALSELKDDSGNTLFSGLRHGVLDAYGISAQNLGRLPDSTVRQMITDLLLPGGAGSGEPDEIQSALADDYLNLVRSSPKGAEQVAEAMREAASDNMAQELATAALATDPGKLERAMNGETVSVSLSSVSLLTPDHLRQFMGRTGLGKSTSDEQTMLKHQTAALQKLAQQSPLELSVRDASGELRTVKVDVKVRTFNFGVNGGAIGNVKGIRSTTPGWSKLMGWGFAMQRNNPELDRLLGRGTDGGAEPSARLTALDADVARLREALANVADAAEREPIQARLDAALEDSANVRHAADRAQAAGLGGEVAERLMDMAFERSQLQREVREQADPDAAQARLNEVATTERKLSEAAEQLQSIREKGDFNKGGSDPYRMVSRLGLVTHLMGETPVFNCKSGKDRSGQMDAEVKYLAALGEHRTLPEPGVAKPELRQMRGEFTMHTGNLEMQRINTGLPGFKLEWDQLPGLANLVANDGVQTAYRGGSAYVAS